MAEARRSLRNRGHGPPLEDPVVDAAAAQGAPAAPGAARRRQRGAVRAGINRLIQSVAGPALNQLSLEQAGIKARHLTQQWGQWQELRQQLLAEEANDAAAVAAEQIHIELEERVMECEAQIEAQINLRRQERDAPLQAAAAPPIVAAAPAAQAVIVRHYREPKVGEFDGKHENWGTFFDLFRVEVHAREDMDDVEKLVHLKAACKGKGAKALGDWPITAANYQLAWAALQEKYQDPYIIKTRLVAEINCMPRLREESSDGLRTLIDTPKMAARQLEVLGVDMAAWDLQLMNSILFKAPQSTVEDWEKERGAGEPTLARLYTWLERRAHVQLVTETIQSDRAKYQAKIREKNRGNGKNESSGHQSNGQSGAQRQDNGQPAAAKRDNGQSSGSRNNAPSNNRGNDQRNQNDRRDKGASPRGPMSCWMCGQNHSLYKCTELLEKGIDDRRKDLEAKGICLECGRPHAGACGEPRQCTLCDNEKHTSLICPKRGSGNSGYQGNRKRRANGRD